MRALLCSLRSCRSHNVVAAAAVGGGSLCCCCWNCTLINECYMLCPSWLHDIHSFMASSDGRTRGRLQCSPLLFFSSLFSSLCLCLLVLHSSYLPLTVGSFAIRLVQWVFKWSVLLCLFSVSFSLSFSVSFWRRVALNASMSSCCCCCCSLIGFYIN